MTDQLARPPEHLRDTEHHSWYFEAAELCDFTYGGSAMVKTRTTWRDGQWMQHRTEFVTHINHDTGLVLTEVVRINVKESDRGWQRSGTIWHLRDPDGKVVLVRSGLERVSRNGEFKRTPHMAPSFQEAICPALGGTPAWW